MLIPQRPKQGFFSPANLNHPDGNYREGNVSYVRADVREWLPSYAAIPISEILGAYNGNGRNRSFFPRSDYGVLPKERQDLEIFEVSIHWNRSFPSGRASSHRRRLHVDKLTHDIPVRSGPYGWAEDSRFGANS